MIEHVNQCHSLVTKIEDIKIPLGLKGDMDNIMEQACEMLGATRTGNMASDLDACHTILYGQKGEEKERAPEKRKQKRDPSQDILLIKAAWDGKLE